MQAQPHSTADARHVPGMAWVAAFIIAGLAIAAAGATWLLRSDSSETTSPTAPVAQQVTLPGVSRAVENQPPATIFIVASEEQFAYMQTAVNDANSVRFNLGLPPAEDQVVIAASDAQVQELLLAIEEGNRIASSNGRYVAVVDLRGN